MSAISAPSDSLPSELPTTALGRTRSTRVLFRRLRRTGDPRAREALVRRFLPLARKLARRYYSGGEPLDDLVQVASLGLVKAIDRFDENRGVSFSRYAVPTITGELRRYFRDSVWPLHVPRGMQERALAVNRARRELADDTGRNPTVAMLADRLELDEQGVLDGFKAYEAFDTLSLDAPASAADEAESRARIDTIGATDPGFELTEERLTVGAVVQRLPLKERRVLHMRYVEDRTQSDIAARLGVSQMQVSRILTRTIDRLRRTVELSSARAVRQPQLRPR
jgi:RNA polymerase sigma-B factor